MEYDHDDNFSSVFKPKEFLLVHNSKEIVSNDHIPLNLKNVKEYDRYQQFPLNSEPEGIPSVQKRKKDCLHD